MSYILDALKKSQAEQSAEGVSLRVQKASGRQGLSPWWPAAVVAVLLLNAALLAWVFLFREVPPGLTSAPAEPAAPPVNMQPQAAPLTETRAQRPPLPVDARPATAEAQPIRVPVETTAATAADARAGDTPVSKGTDVAAAREIPRLALRSLSAAEQTLYNGFNYSTHIYTDDPSLCAIVIDGQRLQSGDAFKGLKVVAITEQGVVFEENRRGVVREVEVNLLEQWDS